MPVSIRRPWFILRTRESSMAPITRWKQLNAPREQGRSDGLFGGVSPKTRRYPWGRHEDCSHVHTWSLKVKRHCEYIWRLFTTYVSPIGWTATAVCWTFGLCVGRLQSWELKVSYPGAPWNGWSSKSCSQYKTPVQLANFSSGWFEQNWALQLSSVCIESLSPTRR